LRKTSSVSIRIRPELNEQIEALAKAMDRPKSWVCERALEDFVSLQKWQISEIQEGLADADAGDFATEEEVEAAFAKWSNAR
jgi:predicted transcriptional regulator